MVPMQPDTHDDSHPRYPGYNYARHFSGAGAQSIDVLTSSAYKDVNSPQFPAVTVLEDGLACWAMSGHNGYFGIALEIPINISHISIYHSLAHAEGIPSAPRSMVLWGLAEGPDQVKALSSASNQLFLPRKPSLFSQFLPKSPEPISWVPLLHFQYDVHLSDTQVFAVPKELMDLGVSYGVVVVEILNNWGSPSHSCLYHIGVYGARGP
jgi:hypothetical protein